MLHFYTHKRPRLSSKRQNSNHLICQIFIIAALAGYFLTCLPVRTSAATPSLPHSLIEAEKKKEKKLGRLKKGASGQQQRIAQAKEKELQLHAELKDLDQQLFEQQEHLLKSQNNLMLQEKFLEEKEIELGLIKEDKTTAEIHIKNRLKAFYQMGEIGFINTFFSASTLPELLNIKEYFHHLFEYDRQVIKRYKNKISLLAGAKQEILKSKEHLLESIIDIKSQEQQLIESRLSRKELLNKVSSEKQLYKQALTEMQKSAEDLTKKFDEYKKKLIINTKRQKLNSYKNTKIDKVDFSQYFIAKKGSLVPPVEDGAVITNFGKSKGVFGLELDSKGIDIAVARDSNVIAIDKGTVVYAGDLTGYGNVVMIDHGQQYFSLVSRLTTVLKSKGAYVEIGDVIGRISKEQSGLLQKGLHFEIRQGSTPVDPLSWLDHSLINIKPEK